MSSKQGATRSGDAHVRECAWSPTARRLLFREWFGGGGMSSKQGPRVAGMRTSANAPGRRQENRISCEGGAEAAS